MPSLFNRRTQEHTIRRLGDLIWEEVCDTIPLDTPFRPQELVGRLNYLKGYADRTQLQYIKAVLRNVIEQWEYLPPEEGEPPIKRYDPSYRGWYILPSIRRTP